MIDLQLTVNKIDTGNVLKVLGYTRKNEPPPQLQERLDQLKHEIPQTVQIQAVKAPVTERNATTTTTKLGPIASATFTDLASSADEVLFSIVTAGPEMDALLDSCTDMVDALILDGLGSVLVEHGVDTFCSKIAEESSKYVSLPFSPGYCDYPLTEQENIFNALGGKPLGVSYHPQSFMMTPVKTISFVAAMGDAPLNTNPCSICQFKKCQMRRSR